MVVRIIDYQINLIIVFFVIKFSIAHFSTTHFHGVFNFIEQQKQELIIHSSTDISNRANDTDKENISRARGLIGKLPFFTDSKASLL
jgi:hypothetical protein